RTARSGSSRSAWLQSTEATRVCWRGTEVRATPGEQVEAVAQPITDLSRGQYPDSRGGKFDGQRDAVEAAAYLGHDRPCSVVEHEARAGSPGSLDEQLHR